MLLTPSERTLLCLLGSGRTVADLAVELDRQVWTLNSHRSHAYRKLGVHSLEEALHRAVELGEISVWDIVQPVPAEISAVARLAALRMVAQRVVRSGGAVEAAVAARFLALLNGEG
ncbi:response regulator transcription factor [Kitasatospora sp. CMC57]